MQTTRFMLGLLLLFPFSSQAEPLYWQAQKDNLVLMVIGSIHVGTPAMYPLPTPVYDALGKSHGLIIEADTQASPDITPPPIYLTSGQTLTQPQQKQLALLAKQLNQDADTLLQQPPWRSALVLQFLQFQQLGYSAYKGVDAHLIRKAKQAGVPLISLESLQYQVDLLASLPNSGQEMLVTLLDEWDTNQSMTECLIESWQKGDKEKLEAMMHHSGMSESMEKAFITQRNHEWAKKLSSQTFYPKSDGYYVMVVGALHLVGKNNVLDLLKEQGFMVKPLSQSQSQPATCSFAR
ncbi:TraB/GumN family protein [Vibrio cincinnatiensis]|uniref:TraB/GumN family protein n=1 Tax=Vibrio cincinnatiensis TaxID=675 RepID=UPI001EDE3721|nr:TraB/GumN family protein [Vibrio cincinnatiensis]